MTAAYWDIAYFKFPNALALAGAVGMILFRILGKFQLTTYQFFIIATLWLFAIIMTVTRLWGAGDAKFLMILILGYPRLSLVIALIGALLGAQIIALSARWVWGRKTRNQRLPVILFMAIGWFVWVGGMVIWQGVADVF